MASLTDIATAVTALQASVTNSEARASTNAQAISAKITDLEAQVAALTAGQVDQAEIDAILAAVQQVGAQVDAENPAALTA